jgi:hypothetical protein
MSFFDDVVLTESNKIRTTPEKIFAFLTGIIDNASFLRLNAENISEPSTPEPLLAISCKLDHVPIASPYILLYS